MEPLTDRQLQNGAGTKLELSQKEWGFRKMFVRGDNLEYFFFLSFLKNDVQ